MKKKGNFMRLCPSCGQLLYHRAQVQDLRYGSPFQQCPNCGGEYFDLRYQEPALLRNPHLNRLPHSLLGGLLLGGAFLLGAVYLERKLELILLGLLFFGSSAYFALQFYRSSASRKQAFQEELSRSRQRLQDPAYVAKLRDNGITVPDAVKT